MSAPAQKGRAGTGHDDGTHLRIGVGLGKLTDEFSS
jgi:hypothetical protein